MKTLLCVVMSVLMSVLLSQNCQCEVNGFVPMDITDSNGHVIEKIDTTKRKDSIKQELVKEVDRYICNKTKKQKRHKDISEHLVEVSLINKFDIAFAMAQAELETCFGTTGIGVSRKSMYGIYITYKDHNASTDYYIRLVQRKYLGNKKTLSQLANNYVTLFGYRYSSNKKYEYELKRKWKHIQNTTEITKLQTEYYC